MTTAKRATRKTAKTGTAKRSKSTRTATSPRNSTRRRSTTNPTRRKRASTASTIGAGIGTLIVAALLGASWPVRIALVLLVIALGAGYLFVQQRAGAHPAADQPATPTETSQ